MDIKVSMGTPSRRPPLQAHSQRNFTAKRPLVSALAAPEPRFAGSVSVLQKALRVLSLALALSPTVLGRPPEAVKPGTSTERLDLVSRRPLLGDLKANDPDLVGMYHDLQRAASRGETPQVLSLIRKLNQTTQGSGHDTLSRLIALDWVPGIIPEAELTLLEKLRRFTDALNQGNAAQAEQSLPTHEEFKLLLKLYSDGARRLGREELLQPSFRLKLKTEQDFTALLEVLAAGAHFQQPIPDMPAWVALFQAVGNSHPETVSAILARKGQTGYSFNEDLLLEDNWRIFDHALVLGNPDVLKAFYQAHQQKRYHLDLNHTNQDGVTAFLLAVHRKHLEAVRVTLEAMKAGHVSLDFNHTTPTLRQTAFTMALANNQRELVDLFLDYMENGTLQVDMNQQDTQYGCTPLMWALERGNLRAAKRMLALSQKGKLRIDFMQSDFKGLRAVDYAQRLKKDKTSEWVLAVLQKETKRPRPGKRLR